MPLGYLASMTRIAFVVIYLVGMVITVISLDVSGGGETPTLWALAVSVLLGAGTGDFRLAALSILMVPIAIPFGLPTEREADPVFPVWVSAMYFAFFSSVLILIAAFLRQIVESRLRRRRASRGSGIA